MPRAKYRGRTGKRLRLPRNAVYEAVHDAGGPSVVVRELGVSLATLARWRRAGEILAARDALELARLARVGTGPTAQLLLARELAGLLDGYGAKRPTKAR